MACAKKRAKLRVPEVWRKFRLEVNVMSLWKGEIQRYTFYGADNPAQFPRRKVTPLPVSTQLFADISLDVNIKDIAERLFTYEIPPHLQSEVFVGTQVLVPFGRQDLVSGYVMSIRTRTDERTSAVTQGQAPADIPEQTKPISEVLDSKPIFDADYIDFLYWISEYYLCSIADVLQAAIPGEVGPKVKRLVRLTQQNKNTDTPKQASLSDLLAFSQSPNKLVDEQKIKATLLSSATPKGLTVKALKDRSSLQPNKFYAALAQLRRKGEIEIVRAAQEGVNPKLISMVVWTGENAKTKRQEEILSYLKNQNGSIALKQLLEETGSSESTIKRMADEGILTISKVDSFRDPLKGLRADNKPTEKPKLTDQQAAVLEVLESELRKTIEAAPSSLTPWLLHGVTGSGKTEVYMRLIEHAFSLGKAALLLVPEISLTPQLAQRLVGRFGEDVAIWHSALSAGERFDTWRRLQAGELRLLLGARSAILANMPNLGLIILDEEHDSSYKQSSPNPRYSAKKLATERAKREGCFVLLGSATPDSATYFECRAEGKILELPERVHKQALPESRIIDMRKEQEAKNRSIFSRYLQEQIAACLERKEQAILLINRRGYASHVFCKACGAVLRCRNCSVSLVFHSYQQSRVESDGTQSIGNGRLNCHHCGFTKSASHICPECDSPFLRQFGLGTQRVEEEAREFFPDARILRLDSDITQRKGAYEEIFKEFANGNADILVGTQIVAKGLDIAKVTLVGVLAADAAFNLPDFRSLERGFQLLTQVSGRAGRGHFPGQVVLQTYNTDMPALNLAKNQDFATFIEQELASREQFGYPPFSRLVRIVASGPDSEQVHSCCDSLAEELASYLEEMDSIAILGPATCLIERVKGHYRHQILIKNMAGDAGHQILSSFLKGKMAAPGVRLTFDVDPIDLV
jgi:primosomal protein N' (replication factor Y)